ncbi:MAG: acyloxyacyl hydrolase [Flavobacteriales bacterium]
MYRAPRVVLSIQLLLAGALVSAQQPWSIGTRAHYGFLWPHRPSSWILVEGHAAAVELFAERRVHGDQPWHQDYQLPSYGIGVLYTGMANPEKIGTAVRVLPYLFLPLAKGERSAFGLRLGWGVGYIAKPYDRVENTKQIAIGSRINTAIQVMPEYRYHCDRWMFTSGIGIDHWSNGSVKLPNLGLNYLSANIGASYALRDAVAINTVMAPSAFTAPHREQLITAACGVSESGRPLNGQYTVFSLNGQVQWRVGKKGTLGCGADVFNKGALATVHEELEGSDRAELTQVGVHGAGSLLFGRAELFMNVGAYVYTPVPDEAPLFQRLGFRYRSGRHLVWNISLKSHYAVADHWEFGVGYRWN